METHIKKAKPVSPANGSTFSCGSTVPLVARAKTTEGTVKTAEFYASGVRIATEETQVKINHPSHTPEREINYVSAGL